MTNYRLRDVEPMNISSTTNNEQASMFMRHLTGNETFTLQSPKRPKTLIFHSLKYNHPRHCFASGWLVPYSIDEMENMTDDRIKGSIIASLHIEFGGTHGNNVIVKTRML